MPRTGTGRQAGRLRAEGELAAYGLRFQGVPHARGSVETAPEEWPAVSVALSAGGVRYGVRFEMDADHASATLGRVQVLLGREPLTARFSGLHLEERDALVHPYLSLPAAVIATWLGRSAFHASALLIDGRVWALSGPAGIGKTSTVAELHRRGVQVFSDDLLVVDGESVVSGPRCLDLREEPARQLGIGTDVGVLGSRRRWRVWLDRAPVAAPLAGWVHLCWGGEVRATPMGRADHFGALRATHALGLLAPANGPSWLTPLSVPAYRLARPRDLASLNASCDALLAVITSS